MSEKVEHVARAICLARAKVNDCDNQECPMTCVWCVASAKGAIAAMREPTQAMVISAAYASYNEFREGTTVEEQKKAITVSYKAAIDEALK